MAEEAGGGFKVVVNHEEQYSVWPGDKELPAGWRVVGRAGTERECRAQIEEVWTDMRPGTKPRAT